MTKFGWLSSEDSKLSKYFVKLHNPESLVHEHITTVQKPQSSNVDMYTTLSVFNKLPISTIHDGIVHNTPFNIMAYLKF